MKWASPQDFKFQWHLLPTVLVPNLRYIGEPFIAQSSALVPVVHSFKCPAPSYPTLPVIEKARAGRGDVRVIAHRSASPSHAVASHLGTSSRPAQQRGGVEIGRVTPPMALTSTTSILCGRFSQLGLDLRTIRSVTSFYSPSRVPNKDHVKSQNT